MNLFWHDASSTLYEGTPDHPGRMLGWCQRWGDRHTEMGWFAFVKGREYAIFDRERDRAYWPDECMARQAVIDAVKEAK